MPVNIPNPTCSPSTGYDNLIEIASEYYPPNLLPPNEQITTDNMNNYTNYWTLANDQLMLYIAWVPFFTNCQGYGRKILWFDLLEYNDKCQYRTVEETDIVDSIPKTLTPTADYCDFVIQCAFSEDVTFNTAQLTDWWQINDKTTVYYIPSYGIIPDDFFGNRDPQTGYFSGLIDGNTDDMVPVNFYSENFMSGGYPTIVTMKLEYYQVTVTKKVKFISVFYDFLLIFIIF